MLTTTYHLAVFTTSKFHTVLEVKKRPKYQNVKPFKSEEKKTVSAKLVILNGKQCQTATNDNQNLFHLLFNEQKEVGGLCIAVPYI